MKIVNIVEKLHQRHHIVGQRILTRKLPRKSSKVKPLKYEDVVGKKTERINPFLK